MENDEAEILRQRIEMQERHLEHLSERCEHDIQAVNVLIGRIRDAYADLHRSRDRLRALVTV